VRQKDFGFEAADITVQVADDSLRLEFLCGFAQGFGDGHGDILPQPGLLAVDLEPAESAGLLIIPRLFAKLSARNG